MASMPPGIAAAAAFSLARPSSPVYCPDTIHWLGRIWAHMTGYSSCRPQLENALSKCTPPQASTTFGRVSSSKTCTRASATALAASGSVQDTGELPISMSYCGTGQAASVDGSLSYSMPDQCVASVQAVQPSRSYFPMALCSALSMFRYSPGSDGQNQPEGTSPMLWTVRIFSGALAPACQFTTPAKLQSENSSLTAGSCFGQSWLSTTSVSANRYTFPAGSVYCRTGWPSKTMPLSVSGYIFSAAFRIFAPAGSAASSMQKK